MPVEEPNNTKTFTVEYAENGYILRLSTITYVYGDEIDLLEGIKEFLDIERGGRIEIKREGKS